MVNSDLMAVQEESTELSVWSIPPETPEHRRDKKPNSLKRHGGIASIW